MSLACNKDTPYYCDPLDHIKEYLIKINIKVVQDK